MDSTVTAEQLCSPTSFHACIGNIHVWSSLYRLSFPHKLFNNDKDEIKKSLYFTPLTNSDVSEILQKDWSLALLISVGVIDILAGPVC